MSGREPDPKIRIALWIAIVGGVFGLLGTIVTVVVAPIVQQWLENRSPLPLIGITATPDTQEVGPIPATNTGEPSSDIPTSLESPETPAPTSTPTPTPIPPTATRRADVGLLIFGPRSGNLVHEEDGNVKAKRANVDIRDFVVEAILYNPYSLTKGGWDFGFLFRDLGVSDEFRLAVKSNGSWSLNDQRGDDSNYIHTGDVSNLYVSPDASNLFRLVSDGDRGFFFVNDFFIAELDLSSRTNSGDIAVAIGIRSNSEIQGEVTVYEDFTIWTLP